MEAITESELDAYVVARVEERRIASHAPSENPSAISDKDNAVTVRIMVTVEPPHSSPLAACVKPVENHVYNLWKRRDAKSKDSLLRRSGPGRPIPARPDRLYVRFNVAACQAISDERHLWPVWFNLIRQSRPPIVFGEQVSAAILHHWWDDVSDDLEREGYTTRAQIRPASSVGAPHKRDRLWFVAYNNGKRCNGQSIPVWEKQEKDIKTYRSSESNVAHPTSKDTLDVADSNYQGSQGRTLYSECADQLSAWSSGVEWINCPDGKQRFIKSSIPLLANGIPNRVGKLRGYGNAIVPQVAAQFIREVTK